MHLPYLKDQLGRWHCLMLVFLCLTISACTEHQPAAPRESGSSLYSIALPGNDGTMVDFRSFQGKVVVIDFFASWCEPCREVAPQVERIYRQYGQKGVVVVGVSLDVPGNHEAVRRFVQKHNIPFPVVIDDGRIREITGIFSVPAVMIIDAAGTTRTRIMGARRDLYEQVSRQLDTLR